MEETANMLSHANEQSLVILVFVLACLLRLFFKRCGIWLFIWFFFSSRIRHTRSYGDWSSDVCSSDLVCALPVPGVAGVVWGGLTGVAVGGRGEIGRASCRERVENSVVAVSLKKKKNQVESFLNGAVVTNYDHRELGIVIVDS